MDQVINFLKSLSQHLAGERASLLEELQELTKNVEHIKDIVVMQQSYARVSGVSEKVKPIDLVEDALRMNAGALARHQVKLVRDYAPDVPEIMLEKHKVLQILVNLIRNAKYACDDSNLPDKSLTLRVTHDSQHLQIIVEDNGVGIPAENLTRIFSHGFTTRKEGHGFGLHSGALAARELGGKLTAHSDGPGRGAKFTLELPVLPPELSAFPATQSGLKLQEIHATV
jgi:signal transduction histidine kinase